MIEYERVQSSTSRDEPRIMIVERELLLYMGSGTQHCDLYSSYNLHKEEQPTESYVQLV